MEYCGKVIASGQMSANAFLQQCPRLTKLLILCFDNGITRISAARKLKPIQQKIVDEGQQALLAQCSSTPSNEPSEKTALVPQRDQESGLYCAVGELLFVLAG